MWDIVKQWKKLPSIDTPSTEERRAQMVTETLFKNYVVAPWYRDQSEQVGNVLLAIRNGI
jgi:hypothetical protein